MKDNEFPNALSNWRYRVEPDKSVTALNTENGEQCRFPDWAAFWKRVEALLFPSMRSLADHSPGAPQRK